MLGVFCNRLMLCFHFAKDEAQLLTMNMVSPSACGSEADIQCRNKQGALWLKVAAIAAIFTASAIGVALPLLGKRLKFLKTDGNLFFIAKALAAGVILATGFVHILPDAMEALTSNCLPEYPWKKFPFAGFIAMFSSLGTLVVDFVATEYFEKRHKQHEQPEFESLQNGSGEGITSGPANGGKQVVEHIDGDKPHMHIVGMRAHAASHSHSHPEGHHACVDSSHEHVHGHFGHSHTSTSGMDDELTHIRHAVISRVLELGIITHSVIIGLSLGVSESPCTIKPLLGALFFHQFFEGFALGGCISQARIDCISAICMSVFFAITTPAGIGIGIGISSTYRADSPNALIVEGIFDSISAGILVYMALVDLIAADFLSKRLRCDRRLQVFSYLSLFLGATAMSSLALWA
ncbi:hypothetical protein O6H91_15G023800 [Diphasiastrum complanatum]|uniref:Uncharacterized protein n=1 Tax=Diphasiastrum complanatum TaxID=34168 RepID=A0ACC2BGL2_DIPCM|nr:hypothetical protein O6H91_Y403800 [Diphasiastrum complanatum]KAJ7528880.1 hypothetical protein O6H91_15G023800 [Diphasiastrum complanatum]